MNPIRVMIVDDHAILRVGLKMLIGGQPDMEVVGEAGDAEAAMTLLPTARSDIILLDIAMPRVSGLQLLKRMRSMRPETRILILTMHSDLAFARSALSDGASGYVLKESADTDLLTALRAVARGGTFVDPRIASELLASLQRPELLSQREKQV